EISFSYLATHPDGLKKWIDINARSQQAGAPAQPGLIQKTLAMLETIKVPALLLPADADITAPPYVMRVMATHIPGAELHLIPEAGHSANWEQPEVFNSFVLQFLAKHSDLSGAKSTEAASPIHEALAPVPGAKIWYIDTG